MILKEPEDIFSDAQPFQALLSVFKGRLGDQRDKDTAVERCECHFQDQPDKTDCRLIIRMICRHGWLMPRSVDTNTKLAGGKV